MKIQLTAVMVLMFASGAYSQFVSVTANKANLRAAPAQTGKIISVLDKNTLAKVVREKASWIQVDVDGTQGWLHRSTVTAVKEMRTNRLKRLTSNDSNETMGGERVVRTGEPTGGLVEEGLVKEPAGKRPLPKIVSGGILNGKATSLPKPAYPAGARALFVGWSVGVQVLIDESGRVVSAAAVSGHPLLRAAAVSAAQASTFSPTLLNGTPVKVSGIIIYNFAP